MSCSTWHRSKTILLVMPLWPPLEASGHMSGQKALQFSIGTGMTLVAENTCINRGRRPERHVCNQLRLGAGTDCANPCSQNWDIWMYLASFVPNEKRVTLTLTRSCLLFLAQNAHIVLSESIIMKHIQV